MGKQHIFQSTTYIPIPKFISLKLREDLSINCDPIQSFSIKIPSTESKNVILNTVYMSPIDDMKKCETHFKDILSKNGKYLRNIILAGDFKNNSLELRVRLCKKV